MKNTVLKVLVVAAIVTPVAVFAQAGKKPTTATYIMKEDVDKIRATEQSQRTKDENAKVVDLGAAPGGWSQVAAKRVRAGAGGGRVVAIDLLAMDPLPGVECLQLDFLDPEAPERLKALLGGPADVVLTDMAANATGHRATDP